MNKNICWVYPSSALLLSLAFFIASSNSQCSHNQFRCSNGQCLMTEALCNGRRDCPNGEDEPRNGAGWNCRWRTLAKDFCDPATQFRCRFGGCISRTSVCDGRIDCFGGGDEGFDVCENGQAKPVQTPQRPPVNIRTTPAPRTQPPTRRTRPPYVPPQTTSRSQFPPPPPQTSGRDECPPINESPTLGYKITCTQSGYPVECTSRPSKEGTIALYSCDSTLYSPLSSVISSASRKCERGRWTQINTRFGCEPRCGEGVNEIGAFIVGGSTAEAGKWPWMVAIYERSPKGKMEFICGASLISAQAVITAAHCVLRRQDGKPKTYSDLKIVMGKYYRSYDSKSPDVQEKDVGEIIANSEYNRQTLHNDIAIIKLSQSVIITSTVKPVCLPKMSDYREIGQYGTLVGWGRADGKVFKEQLQQAQLPVISANDCIDAHPQFAYLVHKGTFCAGYRNGTSACDGDSGGPLLFRDQYNRHKWVLHGVVSAGIAASSAGGRGCNPNFYTVFTDVTYSEIRLWIDRVLATFFSR